MIGKSVCSLCVKCDHLKMSDLVESGSSSDVSDIDCRVRAEPVCRDLIVEYATIKDLIADSVVTAS